MAIPSTFTPSQISTFLHHISFPPSLHTQRYTGTSLSADIHLLTQLHTYTISAIPYENLWLHYNPTHKNTIDPQDTYTNIVTNARGRGGYCFQVSIFFNHVLRGLGFPAYLSAVRIRYRENGIPRGEYRGWTHLVNIVPLSDGSKWCLDIGFGGDGATAPIQLVHDRPQRNLGSQQIRPWRDWLPAQLHRTEESKVWICQYRNGVEMEWNSFYAFDERAEAVEADFAHLNWFTGSHPGSFQTYTCLVVKFLRRRKVSAGDGAEEGEEEIYGKRMLVDGVVKENLGGKTVVVEDCRTEEERLKVLEKWFGMSFTEEEKGGIRGWGTELRGDGSEGVMARLGKGGDTWEAKRDNDWSWTWKGPAVEE